jgi:putative hemolysin
MFTISLFIILLFLSAFFSGSETALFSLSGFQKKKIQSKYPAAYNTITTLLSSPSRTLAVILIGNMLVNIAATSIATIFAISIFGEKGVAVSIVCMTIILLVFGEVTPKTYAMGNPEGFARFCSRPLHIFGKLIWPIRRVLRIIADIFIVMFTRSRNMNPHITENELKALMTISRKEGIIDDDEEEMIHSIFGLGERSVDEIMRPRVDIIACEKGVATEKLVEIMKSSKHTKIPVYEGTIDKIIGVIYTKEFMLNRKGGDISDFIRKPFYVPETEKIDDIIVKFQSQKTYIAVVLDEFGGTSGIVTLEDALEEIVGEIRDEYDKEPSIITREEDGSYTISGKATIREVNDELGVSLPMDQVTTINGLLLLLFEKVPKQGEYVRIKGMGFKVIEVRNNMVLKVRVTLLPVI